MAVTSLDAALSPHRQLAHVGELITLGVDAITTWTLDAELVEPAYRRAVEAGIRLVTFNSDTPSATTIIRQRTDSKLPAVDAAAYIAERVPGARVLVVGGPPIPALVARTDYFLAAAETARLRVVGRDDNIGDIEETAVPVIESLLDRFPAVEAIWCFNDYTAVAAGRVLRGRRVPVWSATSRGVIVSGISGAPPAIEAIRAGSMTLTYDSLPVDAGRAAIDVVASTLALDGPPPPGEIWVDCVRYDASNVGDFVSWDER